eukprot:gene1323-32676_t
MLTVVLESVPEAQRAALANKADKFGITPVFLAVQKIAESSEPFEILIANGGNEEAQYQAARIQEKAAAAAEAAAAIQKLKDDEGFRSSMTG